MWINLSGVASPRALLGYVNDTQAIYCNLFDMKYSISDQKWDLVSCVHFSFHAALNPDRQTCAVFDQITNIVKAA